MRKLMNKLYLAVCCLFVYLLFADSAYPVVPVITAVCLSAFNDIFDKPAIKAVITAGFAVLCYLVPDFLFFAPLICYDVFLEKTAPYGLALLIPFANSVSVLLWEALALTILLLCSCFVIKYYAVRLEGVKIEYAKLRDDAKELAYSLEQKNKDLMEKQDYEVNLATLNERNRIAREIHDTVGHIMSSSILQVGALIATIKDDKTRESLVVLKDTLSQGMNSIRSSVHDLHNESIDLYSQLYALYRDFKFCPLAFDYEVNKAPPVKMVYSVIAIVKEALANIIKHSDATAAALTFRELPGFYQLIITDNGPKKDYSQSGGIGIVNIKARVESLNGHINIDSDRGFRIFISFPKEMSTEE